MYKFSKIAVIILYPVLKLVLPIFLLGTLGFSLANGGKGGVGILGPSVLISGLLSVVLLIFALYYIVYATKHKLFSKKADGKRDAGVADYFAMFFSILAIVDVASNLFKMLT
jgi:hypothetical protein